MFVAAGHRLGPWHQVHSSADDQSDQIIVLSIIFNVSKPLTLVHSQTSLES